MTEWNEQAAPNNNLKGRCVEGRPKSDTLEVDEQQLKNKKIQGEILEQNL